MNVLSNYEEIIKNSLECIKKDTKEIQKSYESCFHFDDIFSSENGGKTRLNREVFDNNHLFVNEKIIKINNELDKSLVFIKDAIKDIFIDYSDFNKYNLEDFYFEDSELLNSFIQYFENKKIKRQKNDKALEKLEILLNLKNRILNLKYYVDFFDTKEFTKELNNLSIEELINSKVIYETIDTFSLQLEELKKFEIEITNFKDLDRKVYSLSSLNTFLEIYKRRANIYIFDGLKYKITIEYENSIKLDKDIIIKKSYLENIIFCLLEQSCVDLIKKELKKGKIHKLIEINISNNKNFIEVSVKNNGFDTNNLKKLFEGNKDNQHLLHMKNLARILNGDLIISPIPAEGMLYTFNLKTK